MARRATYDRIHELQVFTRNGGYNETRNVNINIFEMHDCLQIKARDIADFVFNYTVKVDLRHFESMRSEQSLDINFDEFKTNLIDMLHQVQKQEMFLKCEVESNAAKLIFYGKSKIKAIVFLIIDLQITGQKEIFDEMNGTIVDLQGVNRNVTSQLQIARKLLSDREGEIKAHVAQHRQLERRFRADLQDVQNLIECKMRECTSKLLGRVLGLTQRLLKLSNDFEVVKAEAKLKSDSSARLLQSMESLRAELYETSRTVEELRRENFGLRSSQCGSEKALFELNERIAAKESQLEAVQNEKEILERDVKQATLIIAQKTAANDELARDLVQANQMLVNFNHIYDTKNKEIEDLQNSMAAKDRSIQEQNQRLNDLYREFNDYKSKFNEEEQNKLRHELFVTNKKAEEVEKLNRETLKLNELLTRKLASGDFVQQQPFKNFR